MPLGSFPLPPHGPHPSYTPDYEALIQAGKLDTVLLIPEDYGKDFAEGHTAELHLVMDNSRNQARKTSQQVRRLLEAYAGLARRWSWASGSRRCCSRRRPRRCVCSPSWQ